MSYWEDRQKDEQRALNRARYKMRKVSFELALQEWTLHMQQRLVDSIKSRLVLEAQIADHCKQSIAEIKKSVRREADNARAIARIASENPHYVSCDVLVDRSKLDEVIDFMERESEIYAMCEQVGTHESRITFTGGLKETTMAKLLLS